MLLMIFCVLLWRYYRLNQLPHDIVLATDLISKVDFDSIHLERVPPKNNTVRKKNIQYFYFDPNTISLDSLKLLGIPHWVANNLIKYRNKGGKMKNPKDLQKIYGIKEHFKDIAPYIRIENNTKIAPPSKLKNPSKNLIKPSKTSNNFYSEKEFSIVELNSADSTTIVSIRGIGPYYYVLIKKYREKLGGFYSVNQLRELKKIRIENLEMILAESIMVDTAKITKININTSDFKTLVKHPYINKNQANAILNYRKVHGNYEHISDTKKIIIISPADYKQLRWYLTVK